LPFEKDKRIQPIQSIDEGNSKGSSFNERKKFIKVTQPIINISINPPKTDSFNK
jgi:hypothetical protein